jgi:hypothetical protein
MEGITLESLRQTILAGSTQGFEAVTILLRVQSITAAPPCAATGHEYEAGQLCCR